jgi:hypothetical protein
MDAAGNAPAISSITGMSALALPVIDSTAPTLRSNLPGLSLSLTQGSAGNSEGETITLSLSFDGPVLCLSTGSTSSVFQVGGQSVPAAWGGTEGSATRTLSYTVAAGDNGRARVDEQALKAALVAGLRDAAGNAFALSGGGPYGGNPVNAQRGCLPPAGSQDSRGGNNQMGGRRGKTQRGGSAMNISSAAPLDNAFPMTPQPSLGAANAFPESCYKAPGSEIPVYNANSASFNFSPSINANNTLPPGVNVFNEVNQQPGRMGAPEPAAAALQGVPASSQVLGTEAQRGGRRRSRKNNRKNSRKNSRKTNRKNNRR